MYNKDLNYYKQNPDKAIEQLEFCNYECQGGLLENNIAFIALKSLVEKRHLIRKVDSHMSDCATNNMPAYDNGECDCKAGMEEIQCKYCINDTDDGWDGECLSCIGFNNYKGEDAESMEETNNRRHK